MKIGPGKVPEVLEEATVSFQAMIPKMLSELVLIMPVMCTERGNDAMKVDEVLDERLMKAENPSKRRRRRG